MKKYLGLKYRQYALRTTSFKFYQLMCHSTKIKLLYIKMIATLSSTFLTIHFRQNIQGSVFFAKF